MLLNTPIKVNKNSPGGHVVEQLAAYLDYELPEPEREAVREHLRRCPQCENDLATLRAAKQLLRDLPPVTLPRSFKLNPDQVAALGSHGAAVPALAAPVARISRWVFGLRVSAAGLALLLIMLLSVDLLGNAGTSASPSAPRPLSLGASGTAPPQAHDPASTDAAAAATTTPVLVPTLHANYEAAA
ncbi:MAG TPA: zf-HC2 domain-containing protein, partial [Chloroflexia bacterium]|nr:zf-HC2 domain-containing protein [Chloroflexia bacterium]